MSNPGENFSIVVVGAMNPAIHHPLWYEHIGVLTKEEVRLALADPNFLSSAVASQFSVGSVSIVCIQQRWHVSTTDESLTGRLLDIAEKTHETLEHTPVGAVGINFDFSRPAPLKDVGRFLASQVHSLSIGVGSEMPGTATIAFVRNSEDEMTTIVTTVGIAPVQDHPSLVLVRNNVELRIKGSVVGKFSLGSLLKKHFPVVAQSCGEQLARTLEALGRGAK